MSDRPVIFPPQFHAVSDERLREAVRTDPTLIWRKALQLESQLQERDASLAVMREALEGYEQWEAAMILSDPAWDGGRSSLPTMTQELWDTLMMLQARRNAALATDAGKADVIKKPLLVVDCREVFTKEYVTLLEADLAEARAVLKMVEAIFRGNGVSKVCPICTWPKEGHAPDCRLAKVLG